MFLSVFDIFRVHSGPVVRECAGRPAPPYLFTSVDELLARARERGLEIFELVMANECTRCPEGEVRAGLLGLWSVMCECIERGTRQIELRPGRPAVRRSGRGSVRVASQALAAHPLEAMDWVNAWALAVNEEHAAGGRVVTAPTHATAGIVPAVLHYYCRFEAGSRAPVAREPAVLRFLLTAAAIAMLCRCNSALSGAAMGHQGEMEVACSMAAAGLVAALNGTNEQVGSAASIGMEHNPGLPRDRVTALVPVHRIERNAAGAIKAIRAARLALRSDASHEVSPRQQPHYARLAVHASER